MALIKSASFLLSKRGVAGADGSCAVADCFGDKPEAKWLAEHAYRFGFIIRYPEGKEAITGYKYEPWHLRYVGVDIAAEIQERASTLEEYFDVIPVINFFWLLTMRWVSSPGLYTTRSLSKRKQAAGHQQLVKSNGPCYSGCPLRLGLLLVIAVPKKHPRVFPAW